MPIPSAEEFAEIVDGLSADCKQMGTSPVPTLIKLISERDEAIRSELRAENERLREALKFGNGELGNGDRFQRRDY